MKLDYQPTIWWGFDERQLKDTAEFLCVANPQGSPDVESKMLYIKSHSTCELMRHGRPIDIATGGWQVCFFLNTNDSGVPDDFEYYAIVSITPYTAKYYMKQREAASSITSNQEVPLQKLDKVLTRIADSLEDFHVTIDHAQIDHAHIDDIGEIKGDVVTHPKSF